MTDYDKIPRPPKRCEICANGTMHEHWRDVYRCALDGNLKDYRVTCENYMPRLNSFTKG